MKNQRGGFFLGMIVGLLVGLSLALGVALYIAKVPVPFVNKVPQRSAEQDAAEAEKNRNWDPNGGLSNNRAPARPAASSSGIVPPLPAIAPSVPSVAPPAAGRPVDHLRRPGWCLQHGGGRRSAAGETRDARRVGARLRA